MRKNGISSDKIDTAKCLFSASDSPDLVNITTEHEVIEAEAGDDVTLKCFFNSVTDGYLSVNWYKTTKLLNGISDLIHGAKKIWIYHRSPAVDQITDAPVGSMSSLVERNIEFPESSGHSIRIKNITLQDRATYVCQIELDFGSKGGGMANISVNIIS